MSEHYENLRDEDEQGYREWCNARDKAEARVAELESQLTTARTDAYEQAAKVCEGLAEECLAEARRLNDKTGRTPKEGRTMMRFVRAESHYRQAAAKIREEK